MANDGLHTLWGSSGSGAGWLEGYSVDFTGLETADLDHTAATVSVDGKTWTLTNTTTYLDDMDVTNGTGLVWDMSASSSSLGDIYGGTQPYMHIDIADLVSGYGDFDAAFIELMVDRTLPDANDEACGLAVNHGTYSGFSVFGVGIGQLTGVAGIVRWNERTSSPHDTAAEANTTSDCLAIRFWMGDVSLYHGVSVGGEFPSSYTLATLGQCCIGTGALTGANNQVILWACTGNTSNNFAPAFKKLRIKTISGIGQPV